MSKSRYLNTADDIVNDKVDTARKESARENRETQMVKRQSWIRKNRSVIIPKLEELGTFGGF
jgi:hypothetical protein